MVMILAPRRTLLSSFLIENPDGESATAHRLGSFAITISNNGATMILLRLQQRNLIGWIWFLNHIVPPTSDVKTTRVPRPERNDWPWNLFGLKLYSPLRSRLIFLSSSAAETETMNLSNDCVPGNFIPNLRKTMGDIVGGVSLFPPYFKQFDVFIFPRVCGNHFGLLFLGRHIRLANSI